jgi:hypothetical protein
MDTWKAARLDRSVGANHILLAGPSPSPAVDVREGVLGVDIDGGGKKISVTVTGFADSYGLNFFGNGYRVRK